MIPTLEDIIRMLLEGSCTPEQARAWLQAHEDLNREVEGAAALHQMTLYRGHVVLNTLQRMFAQDDRWGKDRTYPSFDVGLQADADIAPSFINGFYAIPTGVNARRITEARANLGELAWMDILVEEVAKLPEAYENETLLRDHLLDVAAVAMQWAQKLTRIEVTLNTTVDGLPGAQIKTTIPDQPLDMETEVMMRNELSTDDQVPTVTAYEVYFNGKRMEDIIAIDAREAGRIAAVTHGNGTYMIYEPGRAPKECTDVEAQG